MLSDLDAGMLAAIEIGQVDTLRELLAAGANPNILHKRGARMLEYAAGKGETAMVELLVRAGADTEGRNYFHRSTALHAAAYMKHDSVIEMLLNAGADINATSKEGATALCCAAFLGNSRTALLLLEHGAEANVAPRCDKDPLGSAVNYNNAVLFSALLEAGAVMRSFADGETALTLASHLGRDAFVPALIRAGADVNAVTNDGWTALTLQFSGQRHVPPSPRTIIQLIAAGARMDMEPAVPRVDHAGPMQAIMIRLPEVPDADLLS
jgi:ankyrin repeat protein